MKLKLVENSIIGNNGNNNVIVNNRLSNPLRYLWGWILPNVVGQVINLVESGLLLNSTPPSCLIIQNSPELSNYVSLAFVLCTAYLGFIATIVYVLVIKVLRARAKVDRSVQFSK